MAGAAAGAASGAAAGAALGAVADAGIHVDGHGAVAACAVADADAAADADFGSDVEGDVEADVGAEAEADADADFDADFDAEGVAAGVGVAAPGRHWPRWLLFAAVTVAVVVAGLDPLPLPERFPQQDKLHHLLGFAALYASARIAFPRVHGGRLVAACLAAALLIELAQGRFLPHRTASLADMLANAAGVALGAAGAHAWQRRQPTPPA